MRMASAYLFQQPGDGGKRLRLGQRGRMARLSNGDGGHARRPALHLLQRACREQIGELASDGKQRALPEPLEKRPQIKHLPIGSILKRLSYLHVIGKADSSAARQFHPPLGMLQPV